MTLNLGGVYFMISSVIKQQKQLIKEAEVCLKKIEEELTSVVAMPANEDDDSEIDNLRTLQLVLQFRLDTQDALQKLFRFNQGIWEILGVSPQNSSSGNLERLAFALGKSDLQHALSMLNRLIDSLLRVLQRYYLKEKLLVSSRVARMAKSTNTYTSRRYQKMVRIVEEKKSFIFILNQLTKSLQAIAGEPMVGPVLDHIGKLEGPISHFYQALQNGLVLSEGLYEQLEETCQLTKKLDELIHQADLLLTQSHEHQLMETPKLFHMTKALSTSQRLEERATEKRLGHFF